MKKSSRKKAAAQSVGNGRVIRNSHSVTNATLKSERRSEAVREKH